jgi:phosphoglycolate phosphatase
MLKYRGIIFDLDGTLADTLADIGNSMNRILLRNGFPVHPLENYKLLIGRGLENLVRSSFPEEERANRENVSRLLGEFIQDYGENCLAETKLYPGIGDVLSTLRDNQVKRAVFSNKADDLTRRIVTSLLPDAGFVQVLGARPDIGRKPDPEGALGICERMGLHPGEVVYMGDSDVDMIMATRAGMLPVGVLWGFRPESELRQNGAKYLLHKPVELLPVFRL